MSAVRVTQPEDFEAAFGSLGARVGARIGTHKRTQDEKEWFVLRRFMARALETGTARYAGGTVRGVNPQ
jgi:hypothetical protein